MNKTNYNEYPAELREAANKRIAQLGGRVMFQLTTGQELTVPGINPGSWEKRTIFNSMYSIQMRDTVSTGTGYISTAVILEYDGDNNPRFDSYYFKADETGGVFSLRQSNPKESRILEYLLLGNLVENGVNPNRDKRQAICRIIDREEEGRTAMEKLEMEDIAYTAAMSLPADKIREFAAAMNWNENDSITILKPMVVGLAKAQPEWFNKFLDSEGIRYRSVLKQAMSAGTVSYELTTNEIRWAGSGETVATMKDTSKDFMDNWVDWVKTHPKGRETIETLTKQLKKGSK